MIIPEDFSLKCKVISWLGDVKDTLFRTQTLVDQFLERARTTEEEALDPNALVLIDKIKTQAEKLEWMVSSLYLCK
jgi:DNA-binding ferritin-like protein